VAHGGQASEGRTFEELPARISDRFRVLGLDLLGHGDSPWEPPWDVGSHLDAIVATVGHGPAVYVGHSFGGRLGVELAAREPELVERLVLLAPAIQIPPEA